MGRQKFFSNALKVATGLDLGYLGPLRLCKAVNILAVHRLYLKRVTGDESKMVGPLVAMSTSHFKGFAKGEEHLDELRGFPSRVYRVEQMSSKLKKEAE